MLIVLGIGLVTTLVCLGIALYMGVETLRDGRKTKTRIVCFMTEQMTSGSNGLIKFCRKCGKWPNIGWMESFFPGAQPSGFAMCDCLTPVVTPQEVDYFKIVAAWNARCDRLSQEMGKITDKEEQPHSRGIVK